MDQMEDWEVYDIYEALSFADVNGWEQIRWLGYLVAQINCKKTLSITDVLKLPWDAKTIANTSISNEDIERLKQRADQIGKLINIQE